MPAGHRRTAVLSIVFGDPGELRALDVQREYRFDLELDGHEVDVGKFRSPLGDEDWRDFINQLRRATSSPKAETGDLRSAIKTVRERGALLHRCLRQLSPHLERFLADRSAPRRLVIRSACAEIHRLPWEAMLDETANPWRSPAEADLSVVHATDVFNERPSAVTAPIVARAIFGPRTERRTLEALKALDARARRRRDPRVVVRGIDRDSAEAYDGDVMNVEAHGDKKTGDADVGSQSPFESTLADHLGDRRMVLLWSCHSGFVHSWGDSLAMKLHRQNNAFVLAFATDLHFDTSKELAEGFYKKTFDPESIDPETAVVQERLRLYRERQPACEWASLMLWLRAPLDLSAVALDGPRILPGASGDREVSKPELERLERVLRQEALPGRPVLACGLTLSGGLPTDLVEAYRGAVVHIRADAPDSEMTTPLEALGVRAPSIHRADRFLSILDRLAAYPDSLLVWSGVGGRELDALAHLEELPRSLSIILTTPFRIDPGPGLFVSKEGEGAPAEAPPPPEPADKLAELESTVESGQHKKAVELWQALHREHAPDRHSREYLRLQIAGYWALVRLGRMEEAEGCVADVKRLAPVEGLLLEGNLAHRRARYDEARRCYAEASQAQSALDKGRGTLEQAFLASEGGDTALAERLFLDAIELLESTSDFAEEPRWASALGRALRDYADVLASQRERVEECLRYLRRALTIHAFDGRLNQVGAALKTRAKLERARKRWDRAEEALFAAASVLLKCQNKRGWTEAIVELAEVAVERGRGHQALAIATVAKSGLRLQEDRGALGRIALLAARAAWHLGRIEEAAEWSHDASEWLPHGPQRIVAQNLRDVLASLGGGRLE